MSSKNTDLHSLRRCGGEPPAQGVLLCRNPLFSCIGSRSSDRPGASCKTGFPNINPKQKLHRIAIAILCNFFKGHIAGSGLKAAWLQPSPFLRLLFALHAAAQALERLMVLDGAHLWERPHQAALAEGMPIQRMLQLLPQLRQLLLPLPPAP